MPLLSVLSKPLLEMNKRFNPMFLLNLAALPGGEALVCWQKHERLPRRILRIQGVSKINNQGQKVLDIYNCTGCTITGLLVLGEDIFIIHNNGTLLQLSIKNWKILKIYQIKNKGGNIHHRGSLASDPSMIPDQDQLLLADSRLYEVFTYRLSTKEKKIRHKWKHIYGRPHTVSYGFYNNSILFIVCVCYGDPNLGNKVIIYDSEWNHVSSFGGTGSKDGQLSGPYAAIVSSDNTIIVADYHNNRLSEFTMKGQFVRQTLDSDDGITKPNAVSFWFPHLWVIHSINTLQRYKYE